MFVCVLPNVDECTCREVLTLCEDEYPSINVVALFFETVLEVEVVGTLGEMVESVIIGVV